ncbi:MAG: S-layer homology domain-containing protein [Oscillospiraceae bacterium]|nr:S-layer homology domain-containing protein [Oscillospiraceae bacterium]
MRRKILSVLLSAALVLSLFSALPVTAWADLPEPTMNEGQIYANGVALILADGTTQGNTVVYIDADRDGEIDAGESIWAPGGAYTDQTAQGNDLSTVIVYGGSYQAAVSGDTKITMLGGAVGSIGGGGSGIGNSVTGNISVDIRGGTVSGAVTGDTVYENVILSSVSVNISGGAVGGSVKMTEGNTTILTRSLTVSGSAAIGAGATDGIRINVGSVTDGVDSFVIDGGLTGADGSVHVLLPAFFGLLETATVATGAASGDLAKIRLAGIGADGKFACLDGTDVKAAPLPIINTTSHRIYAYGAPLLIASGSGESTTTVYVDADGDGEKDSSEKSLSEWGVSNAPADNADLSDWLVYGAYSDAFTGDTRLTMTGGTVSTLCGGGDASVTGNTAVTIHGGTVISGVYGGVYGGISIGSVTGDTSVVMTGGDVNTLYSGGGCDIYGISVSGTASASITGGTVRQNINKSVGGNVDGSRLTVGGGAVIGEDDSYGIILTASVSDIAFFDFLIAPDLTQDASIHVWLPYGFGASSNRIIATGAVSGDLAAIELAGPGAAGKGIYLDGTDIKVGTAYSVTLEGGGTGATGGGNHVAGTAVAINAGTRSGYTFDGWSSSSGVAFANASSASTTFNMPGNAVSITASWSAASSGGEPSGGTGNKTESVRIVSADGSTTATGTMTSSDNGLRVNIPSGQVDRLAGSGQSVRLETDVVTVGFDAAAMAHIDSAAGANAVVLEIALVDAKTLSEADRDLVGGRPVYDFSLTAGSAAISDFGGGTASIGIPYTLAAGEDLDAIVVYYVSDAGTLETVRGRYNAVTGMVEFKTNHFSKYAVGYNKVAFSDVSVGSWSENAVTFIAARGIASGTGNGAFSPDAALTRGQFIVMLMRSYGIGADANPTDNFTDAGKTYYTNYLAAAKRLGISNGMGGNRFEPGSEITRQDMFTMLYRALDVLGEYPEATVTRATDDFEDAGQISDYAEAAMNTLVGAGIISGSGGKLNPAGSTTRAEMAQVLYNLLRKS